MKYYDTELKSFVIAGVHGGKRELTYTLIPTKVGVDKDGNDIIQEKKYPRGYKYTDIPDHWLKFEDKDPRFGTHPGKVLEYVAGNNPEDVEFGDEDYDYGDLVLVDIPPLTAEQEEAKAWKLAKAQRNINIQKIKVTVMQDMEELDFDGDELSQDRMLRAAMLADNDDQKTAWKLATNVWHTAVQARTLREAARLAGVEQVRIMTEAEQ